MSKGTDPEEVHYAVQQIEGQLSGIDAELAVIDRDIEALDASRTAASERRTFLVQLAEQYRLMLQAVGA